MSSAPQKNVTRWAPMIIAAGRRAGFRGAGLSEYVAATLMSIHGESRGNPEAEADGTNAFGLTQQVPHWYAKRWGAKKADLQHHLNLHAAGIFRYMKLSGHMPSSTLAWGSGGGGVERWVREKSKDPVRDKQGKIKPVQKFVFVQLKHQEERYHELYPAYSTWLVAWTEAGQPTRTETITVLGKAQRVRLAEHGVPVRAAQMLPNPYDGTHRWRGRVRTYGPAAGASGDAQLDLSPRSVFSRVVDSIVFLIFGDDLKAEAAA